MLPEAFLNRMKNMLGDEFPAFLASYDHDRFQALRINPSKGSASELSTLTGWNLTPVPWNTHGFYYDNTVRPGKHPYHEAGAYYIQEPSAMAPAEYLEAKPGEFILDLCAAPGGKSTQIAGAMQGQGVFVSNEIHPARAKILSENIERMGIRNAIVTNESPEHLAELFPLYFDRIMVDAPCSGEGMFRKNEDACLEWSEENVSICADRQDHILDCAAEMLVPGGRIVYSTCTFAPAENESSIARFLKRHPDFSLIPAEKKEGFSAGVPAWSESSHSESSSVSPFASPEELTRTIRLWPHLLSGEGHFFAVLEKSGTRPPQSKRLSRFGLADGLKEKELKKPEFKEMFEFFKEYMNCNLLSAGRPALTGELVSFGDQIYLLPPYAPSLKQLKVLRPGLHLGSLKKNRFEPAHALALACSVTDVRFHAELSASDGSAASFISGNTFSLEGEKGWYLISADGYSLGWGKLSGGIMKNHYPKGLRKQL